MADKKESDGVGEVRQWRSSPLTYVLIIVPVLILGTMALSWLGGSESSDSGGAASTSAPAEKETHVARGVLDRDDEARVKRLPKSSESLILIPKGSKPVVIGLERGVWSREIITPDDKFQKWDYQTIVEPGPDHFYIWFRDGSILKVSQSDKQFAEYEMRRGIFRILVEEDGQKLTVKVK